MPKCTTGKNRVKINVDFSLIFKTIGENETCKGTKIDLGKKGFNEMLLNVNIANSGRKSVQIISIIIEGEKTKNTTQVIPESLPIILEPLTSIQLEIQKEWIDGSKINFLGVIDATGKRYGFKKKRLKELLIETNKYPSNIKKYVNKNTEEVVEAFNSLDKCIITNKDGKKQYGNHNIQ